MEDKKVYVIMIQH